ncbi:nucleotidyltransferase family protein [Altererythrobacter rubellus]|uniref:Nucleotidyltransferase family protein n=1 Tax=Altererythrobacter rubellus TaxID=2173831 RepID=A0A9Y2F9F1_9SPHN|nr:nucleotidyltransferase family protein [Altererythrobacter rubellus]WIW95936.1 nucleotidyltransferase family protein [Altererythrobacter rubellus]
MTSWEHTLVLEGQKLREVLSVIDRSGRQIALVVDSKRRLIGTLSDGDIRRWLIGGGTIDDFAGEVCNRLPRTAFEGVGRAALRKLLHDHGVNHMPVIAADRRVVGLVGLEDLLVFPERPETVVIMAGGLGSRMGSLTHETPKPMLPIDGRPVLQIILEQFRRQGFRRFLIAVNYLADRITDHFGDGRGYDVEIEYLREKKRLGTAGALGLIERAPEHPFIVTNGDVLMNEFFCDILDEHRLQASDLTVMVRDYEMQVPYGVVEERGGNAASIVEKPVHNFKVNTGVYCLSPAVLRLVLKNSYLDMPDLFNAAAATGMKARIQRINGYWIDIGRVPDYERAKMEIGRIGL